MSPKTAQADEERLHKMMEQVEAAKRKLSELQGERKQVLQQMAAIGAKSMEAAKKMSKDLKEEIESDREELHKMLTKLEKEFDWDEV